MGSGVVLELAILRIIVGGMGMLWAAAGRDARGQGDWDACCLREQ